MHLLNTWNHFSKALFLKDHLGNDSHIFITAETNISKYKKIFEFLEMPFIEIKTLWELIFAIKNNFGNFLCNYDIFFASLPNTYELEHKFSFHFQKNQALSMEEMVKHLSHLWYEFREFLEGWDYKKLWDTISIKVHKELPEILLSFWWESIESISIHAWVRSKEFEHITLWSLTPLNFFDLAPNFNTDLWKYFLQKKLILDNIDILTWGDFFENIPENISFDILKKSHLDQTNMWVKDLFIDSLEKLTHLLQHTKNGIIYTKNTSTLETYLQYNLLEHIKLIPSTLHILKSFQTEHTIVICDDILSKIFVKKRVKKKISEDIDLMLQITPGDYIVHREHGIWVYKWIIKKIIGASQKEYLEIEYKWSDKLFVPLTEVARVSKYIGKEHPNLTGLSTKEWTKKLEKVSKDVEKTAQELLDIYAKRKLAKWFAFYDERQKMMEFEASFEFEYTPDQLQAMEDIQHDMEKDIPMERILIWDVWFWKTEVAFSAIYRAFLNKKQSIFIAPLVVLAYEHYQKACERFSKFPINIELLTRFQTQSEVKNILEKLKNGSIDLIIGTHRLLSETIEYKDLWLLIIDEEHKFWVEQKEQIKKFKFWKQTPLLPSQEKKELSGYSIDILSMSATPIPRSLNMALSWVRSFSLLSKAPLMRKGIETFVSKFEDGVIIPAMKQEFERGGQVFFIHNRVETIHTMESHLQSLFPNKKIIVTHGKLSWDELEERILAFKQKKYDILVSSTVIENGIDFSNVNTIFINDAYRFGISQIHQLRGRVWRWDKLGYCYLLYKWDKLSEDGAKRLSTLVEYSHLWAWFELALADLEIRGGGDILWLNQSGLTSEVGLSVYLQMLEEKIETLKLDLETNQNQEVSHHPKLPKIDLHIDIYFWENYFASELDKLNFFREIEYISTQEELEDIKQNFFQFGGAWEVSETNLFTLLEVRILASQYKIEKIRRNGVSYEVIFAASITLEEMKKFLDLDKEVKFYVESLQILKVSCRNFSSDTEFLSYLSHILQNTAQQKEKKRLKLPKK